MPRPVFREQDPFAPLQYSYPGARELHREESAYQRIQVLEHPFFGRMLALDGVVQLTERDEFFYHEMLVHVPMSVHPSPRRALIVGGGDGGSLREALKHPSVESVTLVEIDAQVIEVAKRFLPTTASGFSDPRAEVVAMDGAALLRERRDAYDVIIVDAPDPVGHARTLFSSDTFRAASEALTPEGVFAAQTESLHFHLDFVRETQLALGGVFPVVDLYTQALATYAGNWWTFSIATKGRDPRKPRRTAGVRTRYYSGEVHRRAFLPRRLRQRMLRGTLRW